MEASGQLRAVAILTTGERTLVPIEQEACLIPEPAGEFWSEYLLPLPGIESQIFQPVA
jgi:hypothetical protein